MHFVTSPVHLIVCLSVSTFLQKAIILKFEAKNDHYQSEISVCVYKQGADADNLADALNWLLIEYFYFFFYCTIFTLFPVTVLRVCELKCYI